MINAHEQRIREAAYQIWESEGCPPESEFSDWEIAFKLTEDQKATDEVEKVTGQIKSIIGPDEPFDPNPKPEIDPAPPKPDQPAKPPVPIDPIAPTEQPPYISPTPVPKPIHPTDPVQPGNPTQPIQPYAGGRRASDSRPPVKK